MMFHAVTQWWPRGTLLHTTVKTPAQMHSYTMMTINITYKHRPESSLVTQSALCFWYQISHSLELASCWRVLHHVQHNFLWHCICWHLEGQQHQLANIFWLDHVVRIQVLLFHSCSVDSKTLFHFCDKAAAHSDLPWYMQTATLCAWTFGDVKKQKLCVSGRNAMLCTNVQGQTRDVMWLATAVHTQPGLSWAWPVYGCECRMFASLWSAWPGCEMHSWLNPQF